MKIKRSILLVSFLVPSFQPMFSHDGRVFVDKNGNGVFDKGEKVLKGVCVSDGLHVVQTDAQGLFHLDGHDRERFVFITTPSGYKTNNAYYKAISPSVTAYDFALTPYDTGTDKKGSHRFVQITDTEIFNTTRNEDWVADLRAYAANERIAFFVHTGDICYEKGLKEHIHLMNTENMGVPVYYCLGNHDLVQGKYGEELFEHIYGPVYYSFDVSGVHYVVTPMSGGDYRPGYTQDDVCRWLRNDLGQVKPGTPVYVFNHDLSTGEKPFFLKGSEESLDLLDYNLKAWVYGHWHVNYKKKLGDVWTVCSSTPDKGGIDHSSAAYRVIDVDREGNLSSELRYCYVHRHLCVASPVGHTACTSLTVNAYSSVSPVERMTYSCFDGEKTLWKDKPLRKQTDWTWTAELPLNDACKEKELLLRVRAVQSDGETVTAEQTFIYSPRESGTAVNMAHNWDNLAGNAAHDASVGRARLDSTLQLAWVKNIGANIFMSSPLIHDGRIFVAAMDEDATGRAHIHALDGKTGETLWKYVTLASVKNSMAITEGRLFAQDEQGNLYAISCADGSLCWQEKLPVNDLSALVDGLVADEGVVYAGTGTALSAFEARSGKLLWRNKDWNQREGTTSTLSVGNGVVVGSAQWSALNANDANTGEGLWSLSQYGLRHRGASGAIHGDLLYIISDHAFFIIELRTGRIVVRKDFDYSVDATSTPLLTDREIIFGTANRGLVALDCQTLEELWNCPVGEALVYTSPYSRPSSATIETTPLQSGSLVFVSASDGTFYGINRADGHICWQYATGAPSFSSMAASGNSLVATDFGGNVYVFCTR